MKFILSIILLLFLVISCGDEYKSENIISDADHNSSADTMKRKSFKKNKKGLNCDEGSHLNYDNFGEGFFLTYCTSCHSSSLTTIESRLGAPLHINLDTPEGIELNRVGILLSTRSYLIDDESNERVTDRNNNGIPDEQEDHDNNGIPDLFEDVNENGIPDLYEKELPSLPGNGQTVKMPPSEIIVSSELKLLRSYLECGASSGSDNIK